mmetsp:Transcript_63470/g.138231  ORF Transcript_63470/g.138231 Transcript_63470/m.138231 type:complete len:373 (-) Transcript_63470:71-1189(-)
MLRALASGTRRGGSYVGKLATAADAAACGPFGVSVSRSASTATVAERALKLTQLPRATLALQVEEATALHDEVALLSPEALDKQLGFDGLCHVCRSTAAAGIVPEEKLLQAAVAKLRSLNGIAGADAEAAASLALAVCEAGQERSLGGVLVDELCAAGVASSSGPEAISGSAAAALTLAAAVSGRSEAGLFDALLGRCSAREEDLTPALLGDLRLAALLAGTAVTSELGVAATGFLRTLCSEVLLDDPRGMPPADGEREQALTPFEKELSEVLLAAEVPHCHGARLTGMFLPLSSFARKGAFFAEDLASQAAFSNAPDSRRAYQRWKLRAVAASGWRAFAVSEKEWRELVSMEERVHLMRKVLLEPVDTSSL